MSTEGGPRINWQERMAAAKLDLDQIWQGDWSLHDGAIGDHEGEKLNDAIFGVQNRDNEHEDLRLVPIRNFQNLAKTKLEELMLRKRHMFQSRLWKLITVYYQEHDESFAGFSALKVVEQVRQE